MIVTPDGAVLLDHLSRLLVRATDLQGVVDAALELVLTIGARNVAIYVYEADQGQLRLVGERNHHPDLVEEWQCLSLEEETLLSRAVRTRQVQISEDLSATAGTMPKTADSARRTGFQAAVAFPLVVDGRAVGALACGLTELLPAEDPRSAALHTVAQAVALALYHAQIAEESRQRQREHDLLTEATKRLTRSLDLAATLQDVAEIAAEGIGDLCAIFQVDPEQGPYLRLSAYHCRSGVGGPQDPNVIEANLPPMDRGRLGELFRAGQPLRFQLADSAPKYQDRYFKPFGVNAVVAAPIIYHGEPLGLLAVASVDPERRYDDSELRLVANLADSAAPAIANVQLFRRLSGEHVFLQSVLDHLPEAVLIVEGPNRRLTTTNRATRVLFGRSPAPETPLADWLAEVPCRDAEGNPFTPETHPLAQAAAGQTLLGHELVLSHPDGREVRVLGNYAPVRNEAGRVIAAVAVMQDITRWRELDQEKDDFLAVAAHELRTPLTMISGQLQLVGRAADRIPEDIRSRIEIAQTQVARMTEMAARLLDVSGIGMGLLDLHVVETDLAALVRDVAERFDPRSTEHTLHTQVPDQPVLGWWDSARIEEVLANLLDNAERYSPPGTEITLRLSDHGDTVWLEVEDKGPGIPEEDLPRLFERYSRVRQGGARGGLGLGLYLCRSIVEAHGGSIGVRSRLQVGTTFTIRLPKVPTLARPVGH